MAKLKLDFHDIYNCGDKREAELNRIIQEMLEKKLALVECSAKMSFMNRSDS